MTGEVTELLITTFNVVRNSRLSLKKNSKSAEEEDAVSAELINYSQRSLYLQIANKFDIIAEK